LPDDPQEWLSGIIKIFFQQLSAALVLFMEFSGVKPTGYKRGQRKKRQSDRKT
jgi:hypothetical protein